MDCLTALRKWTRGEVPFKEIEHNGQNYYAFGDSAYPKNTITNVLIYSKQDEFYSLQSLVVFWQNVGIGHGLYVKEAASRDIKAITRIDRKHIQDYLEGKRDDPPPHSTTIFPSGPPVSLRSITSNEPEPKRARLDEEVAAEEESRKAAAAAAAGPIEVRALNENLTVDRIAEMRRKRQMHQKKNIVATDETVPSSSSLTSSKEVPKVRVHKNRDNILLGSKDLIGVLDVLAAVQRQWDVNEKKEKVAAIHASSAATHHHHSSHSNNAMSQQQKSGYSRYAQEGFVQKNQEAQDIQMQMSFIGSNLQSLKQGNVMKSAPQMDKQSSSQHRPSNPSSVGTPGSKRPSRTPIIVVPAALNSMINLYNARDILQNLSFISSETRRNENHKKSMDMVLQRQKSGQTFNIRIIDNVDRLANDDWDRVIAVFVMGVAWQFKGWKWNGNPTEIFTHIPAFHLYFDNDKPVAQVRNWNVHKIGVSPLKRHMDKARFGQVWETIETFCRKNKQHLCPRLGLA